MTMRVGHGFDAHRFGPGDHICLGGVRIAHSQGVIAHSDGDVLIHALSDALLGAAALGDIGQHFPDTDARWKNLQGRDMLLQIRALLADAGYRPLQADCTIVAQAPRVSTHVPAMRGAVAEHLGLATDDLNIKATTTEKMGWIGRGEGLAVHAVATITTL